MADTPLPSSGTPAETAAQGHQPATDPYAWLDFAPGSDWIHESQAFLARLNLVGRASGQHIDVFSAFRSHEYSAAVGGYYNDPHSRGVAVDATAGGKPVGEAIDQATFGRYGLESGNQPNFYQGKTDPTHVQVTGSGVDKSIDANTYAPSGTPAAPAPTADNNPDSWTPERFFEQVLTDLGAKPSTENVGFLASWAQAEGVGSLATWNPLATTQPAPGGHSKTVTAAGVQAFDSPEVGASVTAANIKAGYPSITALLKSNDPGAWVRLGRPGVDSDLRKWVSGNRTGAGLTGDALDQWKKTTTEYVNNVKTFFQGGTHGNLSAADWASYDLGSAASDAKDLANNITKPLQTLYHALAWLVENPARVGLIVAGTGLTAIGVVMLAKASAAPSGSPVRDFSQSAGTVGAVAKVAR